jgi:hypothetical protein
MTKMDKLKNTAPELSKLKKEVPFRTPDNYFDDFSARMHTMIEAEKLSVPEKKLRFIHYLKPALGLAASFALIFMLVYVPLKTFIPSEITIVAETSEYSDSEVLNVLEGLDESSFFTLLNEPKTDDSFTDEELVLYVSANFTDYEIFEYTEN